MDGWMDGYLDGWMDGKMGIPEASAISVVSGRHCTRPLHLVRVSKEEQSEERWGDMGSIIEGVHSEEK